MATSNNTSPIGQNNLFNVVPVQRANIVQEANTSPIGQNNLFNVVPVQRANTSTIVRRRLNFNGGKRKSIKSSTKHKMNCVCPICSKRGGRAYPPELEQPFFSVEEEKVDDGDDDIRDDNSIPDNDIETNMNPEDENFRDTSSPIAPNRINFRDTSSPIAPTIIDFGEGNRRRSKKYIKSKKIKSKKIKSRKIKKGKKSRKH